jgi:flagellar protein FliL
MAATEISKEDNEKKSNSKMGLILIILLGLIGVGGGGVAGFMGLLPIPGLEASHEDPVAMAAHADEKAGLPDISTLAFVDMPKIIVPLGEQANAHHLVAQFSIETTKEYKGRIEELKPRIMDVMNKYLRAVEEKDITDPLQFQRLQALMLNRVQLIAGEQALRNILVQEFILQ